MSAVRHLVLGTAGHIDHGKSALVRALTGIDPDRLQEEKRRGITIDLGFADLALDPARVLSFVDVPGHERFVRHMVAGSSGIDAVLLVVAADEGVQPQTVEHLAICSLLGLARGVVALTKRDLVDDELCAVVTLELRERLRGTFLESAPIVPVSSRTGAGLEDLRSALVELFDLLAERPVDGVPRLPVDRTFVMRGFGTVVTGTLVSGSLAEGDEIEVLPSRKTGRIRGLEVHRQRIARAVAGQRTAVNLQGLDCEDVPRGATLSRPAALATTRRVWARVELLERAPRGLERGGPARLHQGTCERSARLRVLERQADGSLRVEVHLDEDTVLVPGDRFILRRPAPVDTVGGGVVVDAHPPRPSQSSGAAFAAEAVELDTAILLRLDRAGHAGREIGELAAELGATREQLEPHVSRLERDGETVRAGARVFAGVTWRALSESVLAALAAFHRGERLRSGPSREDLRSRLCRTMPQDAWRQMLDGLVAAGQIRATGDKLALAEHEVVLGEAERRLAERIERALLEAGLEPPDLDQLVEPHERAVATSIVEVLLGRGALVRIRDGKLFHARALEDLLQRLERHAGTSRMMDVAAFKALAGVTRKHAIPLLEHLDEQRITRRVGNLREILIPAPRGRSAPTPD